MGDASAVVGPEVMVGEGEGSGGGLIPCTAVNCFPAASWFGVSPFESLIMYCVPFQYNKEFHIRKL
jgi:hypothetical protein